MVCVSFCRPTSPSRAIFSSEGMIAVMSWMMMLALMYGQMESMPTAQLASAPPVNTSAMPIRPPALEALARSRSASSATPAGLMPGVGTTAMRRQSRISARVKKMRERSSGIFQMLRNADMGGKIGVRGIRVEKRR